MMKNPVGWFEIYVQDMRRAKAFYETVFQVTLQPIRSEGLELWSFPQSFEHYGATGALARMEGVPSGGNSTLVYFSCEDCSVEAQRVEGAGGRIMRPKTSIDKYGFIALAYDTEGNLIGLHSMK